MTAPGVLLVACAVIGVLLLVLLLRRPPGEPHAALLQQQLIELRSRFDALIAAQQEVPRALAEGSAEQIGRASCRERV